MTLIQISDLSFLSVSLNSTKTLVLPVFKCYTNVICICFLSFLFFCCIPGRERTERGSGAQGIFPNSLYPTVHFCLLYFNYECVNSCLGRKRSRWSQSSWSTRAARTTRTCHQPSGCEFIHFNVYLDFKLNWTIAYTFFKSFYLLTSYCWMILRPFTTSQGFFNLKVLWWVHFWPLKGYSVVKCCFLILTHNNVV